MMKKCILFLFIVLQVTSICAGNKTPEPKTVSVNVDVLGYYTDNIFVNASAVRDWVSQLEAGITYPGKRLNLYVDASASFHAENPEFNWWLAEPGLEWFLPLKKRGSVFVNAAFTMLRYNDMYTDFNYTGPRIGAGIKLHPSQSSMLKAGYTFEMRDYSNFESFDYINHSIFAEYSRTFKGQVTLQLHAGFNYRYYLHIVDDYDFGEGYSYYDRHRHQGQGSGGNSQGGQGSGGGPGGGMGMGPGPRPGSSTFTLGIPNLHGLVRVKKGIGSRIGITGEAEVRKNFQGLRKAVTLIRNAYILYPLNDDNLWDGVRFGLTVQWLPVNRFSVEASAGYYDKGYRGIFAMDESGDVIQPALEREDTLLFLRIKTSYDFGKWGVFAAWSYRDNDSTDDYFKYSMMTASVGAGYYF